MKRVLTSLALSDRFEPIDLTKPVQLGVFYDPTKPVGHGHGVYYPVYWPRGTDPGTPAATCEHATGIPAWLTTEGARPFVIIPLAPKSHVKITANGWKILGQEYLTGVTASLQDYLNQRLRTSG